MERLHPNSSIIGLGPDYGMVPRLFFLAMMLIGASKNTSMQLVWILAVSMAES